MPRPSSLGESQRRRRSNRDAVTSPTNAREPSSVRANPRIGFGAEGFLPAAAGIVAHEEVGAAFARRANEDAVGALGSTAATTAPVSPLPRSIFRSAHDMPRRERRAGRARAAQRRDVDAGGLVRRDADAFEPSLESIGPPVTANVCASSFETTR